MSPGCAVELLSAINACAEKTGASGVAKWNGVAGMPAAVAEGIRGVAGDMGALRICVAVAVAAAAAAAALPKAAPRLRPRTPSARSLGSACCCEQ